MTIITLTPNEIRQLRDIKQLEAFAHHSDSAVREAVARNRHISILIQAELATDATPAVQIALAKNRTCDLLPLAQLMVSPFPEVRAVVATHPELPKALLIMMLEDENELVSDVARQVYESSRLPIKKLISKKTDETYGEATRYQLAELRDQWVLWTLPTTDDEEFTIWHTEVIVDCEGVVTLFQKNTLSLSSFTFPLSPEGWQFEHVLHTQQDELSVQERTLRAVATYIHNPEQHEDTSSCADSYDEHEPSDHWAFTELLDLMSHSLDTFVKEEVTDCPLTANKTLRRLTKSPEKSVWLFAKDALKRRQMGAEKQKDK